MNKFQQASLSLFIQAMFLYSKTNHPQLFRWQADWVPKKDDFQLFGQDTFWLHLYTLTELLQLSVSALQILVVSRLAPRILRRKVSCRGGPFFFVIDNLRVRTFLTAHNQNGGGGVPQHSMFWQFITTADILLTAQDQNMGFRHILCTDGPPRQLTFVPQFHGLVHLLPFIFFV